MFFEQVGCESGSDAAADARSGDRGQSEVIGTILAVTIVVVLAAVIGQFVFGLDIIQGGQQSVGPQIAFDTTVESGSGDLIIEHQSGNSVETSELTVVGSESGNFNVDWDTQGVTGPDDDEWTASESISLENTNDDDPDLVPGETVRIIWESSTTSDSTVVLKFEYKP